MALSYLYNLYRILRPNVAVAGTGSRNWFGFRVRFSDGPRGPDPVEAQGGEEESEPGPGGVKAK